MVWFFFQILTTKLKNCKTNVGETKMMKKQTIKEWEIIKFLRLISFYFSCSYFKNRSGLFYFYYFHTSLVLLFRFHLEQPWKLNCMAMEISKCSFLFIDYIYIIPFLWLVLFKIVAQVCFGIKQIIKIDS